MGVSSGQVFVLFLARAGIAGLAGAIAGYAAGAAVALFWREPQAAPAGLPTVFDGGLLALVAAVALVLSVAAAWLPALAADRQDPAIALSQEAA